MWPSASSGKTQTPNEAKEPSRAVTESPSRRFFVCLNNANSAKLGIRACVRDRERGEDGFDFSSSNQTEKRCGQWVRLAVHSGILAHHLGGYCT